MSFSETIFLFFLALIIFGPKKLPEIARQAGKWMNEFRRASNEFKAQIEQEISHLEVEERTRKALPPSPAPEGTASRTLNAGANDTGSAEAASTATGSASPDDSAREDEPLFASQATNATSGTNAVNVTTDPAPGAIPATSAQESHV